MNVKLISITQPLIKTLDNSRLLTPEELIVYCARVSNFNNQLNIKTAPKLIKYLIQNKHWSPFEMVDMIFEIKTSRAITSQILRHRSANFQEFSQRYSEVTEFEPIEFRLQGKTNRQVSNEIINNKQLNDLIEQHQNTCKLLYDDLIKKNVAKECARFVLPLNIQTMLYMKNNVRNWIHYLLLRCSENTQKEHRLIAVEIKKIFVENFPNIAAALEWN